MRGSVVIDCFPESAKRYKPDYAIVAVDVIRATTMAITSVALGRRCFPVHSPEAAMQVAQKLDNPLLAGELAGDMPGWFHMSNSPSDLSSRTDVGRPLVLLSTSGTRLLYEADGCAAVYVACFRNHAAVAAHVCGRHAKVAVIGAGSRGEFREEDQMCCAWIAADLLEAGYIAETPETLEIANRWKGAPADACASGNSAAYLRRSGQIHDLDFILSRVNDLDCAFLLQEGEVVCSSNHANGR